MSETNDSVAMLEPIEDLGGVAQPLLQVNGLTKHFPVRGGLFAAKRTVRAVDNVSFSVAKGETVGIVGESGCGKSTTARLLMHLMPRDTGDIIYDGMTVGQALSLRELRRGMQMVFQDSYASLNPRLTIEESIAFGPKVHGMADGTARALARELLGKVGLRPENFANRYPHEISGGQRQRVNIARALALSPRLVILDEAVSAARQIRRGAGAQPARRPQARVRPDLSFHQPRSQRRALHQRSCAGDVSRRGRRARPGRPGLGPAGASLYARAAGGDAVLRS
ncbi:ABC-type glutathione transport system ATPase component [Bradyrhizobium diazoefficiens]